MKKALTYLTLFGAIFTGWGQSPSPQELLDKVNVFYTNTPNYELEMTYSMFRGLEGKNRTEKYMGVAARKEDKRYLKVLDIEIYTFKNAAVTMDHGQKILVYEQGNDLGLKQLQLPTKALLKQFGKHRVSDDGSTWVLELVNADKHFTQNPYGKMVYHIDKDDYKVVKQLNYFTTAVPFKTGEDSTQLDYGRMEIDMEYREEPLIEFRQLNDFVVKNPNGDLMLEAQWNSYEFHDSTKKNN